MLRNKDIDQQVSMQVIQDIRPRKGPQRMVLAQELVEQEWYFWYQEVAGKP